MAGKKTEKKRTRGMETMETEDLRLSPERRVCSKFDASSVAAFRVAAPGEMGFRVVDNCAEEHMM